MANTKEPRGQPSDIINPLLVEWKVTRHQEQVLLQVVFATTEREYANKRFRRLQIPLDVKGTLEFAEALRGTARAILAEREDAPGPRDIADLKSA
ncbi:MAG TPA: hypothetical protein VGO18_00180 [Steroidobacteraceae bacterium]|nr:hypothetical protein [Steroidobacteraceae bacterium]